MIKAKKKLSEIIKFMEGDSVVAVKKEFPTSLVKVNLPKINIKIFSGEAIHWRSFIDVFDATVHARSDMSEIEKLTYLKGFLSGNALKTIEGLPLTSSN